MVKSVLGVNHQGLRDWAIQRISALVMIVYLLSFFFFIATHPHLNYETWRSLFSHIGIKVGTLLFLGSLLFHAWVGVWTIFTDYIKPYVLCLTLNFFVMLSLIACFFWGLIVVWSV